MIQKLALAAAVVSTVASSHVAQAVLYGVSSGDLSNLYRISESTGAATLVASISPGYASLTGASFLGGQLYATDIFGAGDHMGTIDVSTGAYTPTISQAPSINWHGLASDESAGLLYTIDIQASNVLKSITPGGVVTPIGTGTGIDGRGMAYDGLNGILYATNLTDSGLYRVDVTTGSAQFIGVMWPFTTGLVGLAYDEDTQTLYANTTAGLYRVNVNTGLATLVGANLVGAQIDGLAWARVPEPTTGALIAIAILAPLCLRPRLCRRFWTLDGDS